MSRFAPVAVAGLLLAACAEAPPPPDPCECGEQICGRLCDKACGVCPDDGVCSADKRSCIPALAFGSACSTAIQCGTGRLCLDDALVPGGYCSRRCSDTDPCPDEAPCRPGPSGENVCLARCEPSGAAPECRTSEGYRCDPGGYCAACVGQCASKTCGDDGCGGSCGVCDGDGQVCDSGLCTGVYTYVTKMPQAAFDLFAFDSEGIITLVGGREVIGYDPGSGQRVDETRGVARVVRYNTQTGLFSTFANLPEPIARPNVAQIGSAIYVAGGTIDPDVLGAPDTAAQNFYRQASGSWTKLALAGLPAPSMGGAMVSIGTKLYLFPGETSEGISARVDVYDSTTERWSAGPARPSARTLFAAVSDGSRAYLLGGWSGTSAVGTVEIFDPTSGWTRGPDLPVPIVNAHATIADDRIFLFGGREGPVTGNLLPMVQVVELATRRTSRLGSTYQSLLSQVPAASRGAIYLFSATQVGLLGEPTNHDDVVKMRIPAP